MTRTRLLATLLVLAVGSASRAAITTFVDDEAGFTAAAGSAFTLIDVEDFEDNTVLDGETEFVPSGLSDTTPNSDFPNGLSVPVTITSSLGLRATKNLGNVVGTVLGNQSSANTVTLTFDEEDQVKAIGFNPVTPFSDDARYSVALSLFDGTFVPNFTLLPVDAAGTGHVGFTTEFSDSPIQWAILGIAQINGTINRTPNGLDNLAVYTIPEPSSAGLVGALLWCGARRRG